MELQTVELQLSIWQNVTPVCASRLIPAASKTHWRVGCGRCSAWLWHMVLSTLVIAVPTSESLIVHKVRLATSHHHHLYSFFPPHCLWLEHSSWSGHQGLFPWGIQGYDSRITQFVLWYSTDNWCKELLPYHEEPLFSFSFSCFLLLSFVAPLVCFCCSLHSTPSITWPVYYRLRVFNIVKLSLNMEEEMM